MQQLSCVPIVLQFKLPGGIGEAEVGTGEL